MGNSKINSRQWVSKNKSKHNQKRFSFQIIRDTKNRILEIFKFSNCFCLEIFARFNLNKFVYRYTKIKVKIESFNRLKSFHFGYNISLVEWIFNRYMIKKISVNCYNKKNMLLVQHVHQTI